jgi:hypothetical protein
MPAFVGALLLGLSAILSMLVTRWLVGLGFGILAYTGVESLVAEATSAVMANTTGLSLAVIQVMSLCKVFTALNLILSAVVGKFAFGSGGAAGALLKHLVIK